MTLNNYFLDFARTAVAAPQAASESAIVAKTAISFEPVLGDSESLGVPGSVGVVATGLSTLTANAGTAEKATISAAARAAINFFMIITSCIRL